MFFIDWWFPALASCCRFVQGPVGLPFSSTPGLWGVLCESGIHSPEEEWVSSVKVIVVVNLMRFRDKPVGMPMRDYLNYVKILCLWLSLYLCLCVSVYLHQSILWMYSSQLHAPGPSHPSHRDLRLSPSPLCSPSISLSYVLCKDPPWHGREESPMWFQILQPKSCKQKFKVIFRYIASSHHAWDVWDPALKKEQNKTNP